MTYNLQIPNPCAEKWAEMKTTGFDCRFCAACQRNIVDFTQKTDAEILAHIRRNKGRICGRFRADQLNRPLLGPRAQRRVGLAAIAAGFATLLSAQQPMQGQKAPEIVIEAEQIKATDPVLTAPADEKTTRDAIRTIVGQVVDAEIGDPLIGAAIVVEGYEYGSRADLEGNFSLQIPDSLWSKTDLNLIISYTGYASEKVLLSAQPLNPTIDLKTIKLPAAFLGEMVGVMAWRPTFKQRLFRFFHLNR